MAEYKYFPVRTPTPGSLLLAGLKAHKGGRDAQLEVFPVDLCAAVLAHQDDFPVQLDCAMAQLGDLAAEHVTV